MPTINRPDWTPKYRRHATGQAVVRLGGRDFYLGVHGSAESRAEYRRLLTEWAASDQRPPGPPASAPKVADVILAYLKAQRRLVGAATIAKGPRQALKRLRKVYGHTLARDFTPFSLRAFRESLLGERSAPGMGGVERPADAPPVESPARKRLLSRKYINRLVAEVRRLFKWAVAEGMVGAEVWHALLAVDGLRRGRGTPERPPVRAVDDATIERTLPHLPPVVADMVRLCRATAMRPGELCRLTRDEVDTNGPAWTYRPREHKTAHLDRPREVKIGPKGQAVLGPYLLRAEPGAAVFSPRDSERQRLAALREARQTPLTPSQRARERRAAARAERRVRRPGDAYTPASFACSVRRACERGGIAPGWTPYQLRHAAAEEARERFGLEAVAARLGHADVETSKIYAKLASGTAERVALAIG